MPKREYGQCKLECPKCHEHWGNMKFQYDSLVRASDVTIVAGKKKKFKKNDDLACSLCGHRYTEWDLWLSIAPSVEAASK